MAQLSVGSDPEFVVKDVSGNLIAAPKALRVPPVLDFPHVQTRYGEIFPDNVNVEFSPNYGKTKEEFLGNLRGCIEIAHELIGEQYSLHAIPSASYPKSELNHPICQKFGCSPDFNSFLRKKNVIAKGAVNKPFRTAGGHIHIGNVEGHDYLTDFDGKVNTVNTFELMVGIPGLLLDHTKESLERRALYGGSGAHRPKPYGVECRSLSNFWGQTPQMASFIYDATQLVGREMLETNIKGINVKELPEIINKGNLQRAEELMYQITEVYPEMSNIFEEVLPLANMDKSISLRQTWLEEETFLV